jgi:hypothetical protein
MFPGVLLPSTNVLFTKPVTAEDNTHLIEVLVKKMSLPGTMKTLLPRLKTLLGLSGSALLLAFISVAHAQTIYSDNFDRNGTLNGSSPGTDLSGATWTVSLQNADNYYTTSTTGGGQVSDPSADGYPYTGAYLPVNGVGSSLGAGLLNFTLTATVTYGTEGTGVGIALIDAPVGAYDGFNNENLGYITDQGYAVTPQNYFYGDTLTGPAVLSIAYNALAGTLTYSANGTPVGSPQSVTVTQIADLEDVSFGFANNSAINNMPYVASTAIVSSFSLVVAVPEPSTWVMMLGGLSLLGLMLNRQRRRA